MQVGLDKQTSANCKARQWFGLDKHCSTLVLTSSKYFQSAAVRADGILFPNLHKALFVGSHFRETLQIEIFFTHIDNFHFLYDTYKEAN
jgi:hypothetical protein